MEYTVDSRDVLIISIVVLFLGRYLTDKITFLKKYNIPAAVTGGLICSSIVAIYYTATGTKIVFDMATRDLLLLVFFSTIGLTAKFRLLIVGGKALLILLVAASAFLVIQDLTGVLLMKVIGQHPAYGLFGGSISFAGGYGTAIAWGQVAEEAGLERAGEIGMACATFGLIAGGIIGGPIAERLIKKNRLEGQNKEEEGAQGTEDADKPGYNILSTEILTTILALAICVEVGDLVNRLLFAQGVLLPGFLTAMVTGIIMTNAADMMNKGLSEPAINLCSEVSLQIFLSMSLMSIQLWVLAQAIGALLLILLVQVTVITWFAVHIIFRVMGRDYDASVIAAGFTGLGLGATPVGIANMTAITSKYGPSPKAFLVIPLVGAFFIDIVNALVIKMFAALPIMSQTPLP